MAGSPLQGNRSPDLSRAPAASHEHSSHVRVLADLGFHGRVRAVEFALWSRPILSRDEVALPLES
jgi:hypothetical protein